MVDISTTPPPNYIAVNGTKYETHTDFRIWRDIIVTAQENLYDAPETDEEILNNWETLAELQRKAFSRVLKESAVDVFNAMLEFAKGYPKESSGYSQDEDGDGKKIFSLKHDMNYIIIAIRNQSGIDLSYNRIEPFHWWLFMLEFQTLNDTHLITQMMRWRSYDGKDKEMIRLRSRVALPEEYTKGELKLLDQIDEMFPNA